MSNRLPFAWRTLRVRLTAWYVILLGLILLIFSLYLYLQLQRSLLSQLDTALDVAASQTLGNITDEGDIADFQKGEGFQEMATRLGQFGFGVRLIAVDGQLRDGFGNYQAMPAWAPTDSPYTTQSYADVLWRLHTRPITSPEGRPLGWLQVGQPLTAVERATDSLRNQILVGLPLLLILAGAVGFFLAYQALRPIDQMTRTAQTISAGDLHQRIGHTGPDDEVGRLARMFDQMLDRLQAAFEHERRFTADASHELRTPLAAIHGQIEVALARQRSEAEYETTLRHLQPQVERLIRLSRDLLYLAGLGLTRMRPTPAPVNLTDLLEAMVEQTQPVAVQHQLTLSAAIPAGLQVPGDSDQLTRLFLNLLDNAIKYTPPGGQVTVRAVNMKSSVEVSIADTGQGIAPEHQAHIFERFYRVETSRARDTGGAGLGLAMAYEIASWHGGTLEVQSQTGAGTIFAVRLPAQTPK